MLEAFSLGENADFFAEVGELAGPNGCKASNDDDCGFGTALAGLANKAATLSRGCMGNAAGVDENKVGLFRRAVGPAQAEPLQQLAHLLAFVLIYLAAESIYGKSSHDMI